MEASFARCCTAGGSALRGRHWRLSKPLVRCSRSLSSTPLRSGTDQRPFQFRNWSESSTTWFDSSHESELCEEEGNNGVRRSFDGLLLDAGGTLLQLYKPVAETYASIGSKYGLTATPAEIKQGFKKAFANPPWSEKLRYQGDGRPFWKLVVSEATGCSDVGYFEEVYEYYARGEAWHLPQGAYETIVLLKDAGGRTHQVAVVSNFDSRLRKLLKDLGVLDLFDAVIISSEVGFEKPDPKIFEAALDQINVEAHKAVHVGDDHEADKVGANAVGINCWLWGIDVKTFSDIQNGILSADS